MASYISTVCGMATKRKATDQIGDSSKRQESTYTDTLKMKVVEGGMPFIVHRDIVCRNSDYFKELCRVDSTGPPGTGGRIFRGATVPEANWRDGPFRHLRGHAVPSRADLLAAITESTRSAIKKDARGSFHETTQLVLEIFELWTLCDRLHDRHIPVRSSRLVSLVDTRASAKSQLARWLTEVLAPQLNTSIGTIELLYELEGQLTAGMWELLLRAKVLPNIDAGLQTKCRYHVHPTEADKYK
ncbi:hypothetical protein LTR17_022530 [Elasticomyces elasticus]|nr:hypothetical protein LTR17_022530 [Elasticomyces elasticus]